MRRTLLCVISGSGALSVLVAAAPPVPDRPQDYTSSRLHPKWVDAHYDVRKTLAELAKCSVSGDPERSIAVLLHADRPLTERERALVTPDCLLLATWGVDEGPIQLAIETTVVRFAFADEVFRRELMSSDPTRLPGAPSLAQPQSGEHASYYRFGECIVRANAAGAKALLSTRVETEAEASAFVQLLPAIESCQTSGTRLSLDKADVRGTVALSYVRLAAAIGELTSRQKAVQ